MAKKKKTIKETVEETAKKAKAAVETASKDNKKTGRENQTPRAVSKSNSSDRKNTSSANKGNGSTGRESQTPRAASSTAKKASSQDYHESRRIEYNKTFSEKRDTEKQKNAQKELEAQKAVLGKKRESTAPKNVMEAVKNGTVDWTKVTQDANSKKALEYTTENGRKLYNTSKGIVDDIKNRYGGKLPTATKADREAAAHGDTMAKKRLEDAEMVKYHQGQMKLLSPYQDAWNPTGKTAADIGEAFQETQKKKKAEKEAKVTRESQIPVDEVMEAVKNGTVDWTKVAQNANAKRARAVEENRTTAERLHDNKMRLAEIKEMEKSTVGKMIVGNPADMPTDDLTNMKKLLREKEQLEKRIQADQSAINAEVDKVTAEKDQRHTTLEKKNYDPAMFEQSENHTFETYEEWDAWRDSVKAQEAIIRAGEEEISIWQKLRRPQEKELAISNAEIRDAETASANRGSQMHGGDAEKIREKGDALTEDVREVDQMILAEREKIAEAKKKLMNLKKYGRAIVTKEEEIDGNAAELPNTMKNATVLGKVDWSKVVNEAVAEEKIRSWAAKPKAETPKGESGVVDAIKSKVGAAAKNARADAGCEVEVPGGTEHMRWEDVAAFMKDGIIQKTKDGKYKTTVLGGILWRRIEGIDAYVDIEVNTSNNVYAWPTGAPSEISSGFGSRIHPISGVLKDHTGIDIPVATGTPVGAAKDGTVIFAGWRGGYGNCVMIDHGNGMVTLYGHNSALSVNVGDTVLQGQTIAKAGSTGTSTGSHCHFEVQVNGTPKNPEDYLGEVTTEARTAHVPNAERMSLIDAFRKEREAVYDNIERLYGDTIMHKVYGKEYDNLSDEEKTAVKKQWRYDRAHPVVDEETRELAWRESRGESAFRQGEAVRYAQPSQTQLEQAERDKRAQKQAAAFDKIRQNDRWNGNIRISSRPIMGDKTSSGEKADAQSYVIEENGKQILIPSVIWDEGKWKVATKEEATMRYHLTGEHYGTFEVPEEADVYKTMIWNSEVMRQENDGDLKAQLVEHRTMDLFDATLGAAAKGYVEAKYSRESFKEMMGTDNKKEKYAKILEEDFYEKSGPAIYEWFEGASSLLGQQVMTHTSAEALFGLGTGAIIGGAKGLTVDSADGGLTLGTATIGGALSGGMHGWNVGSAAVMGEIEAGGAYNEMIEMGIDPATARRVALGVGAINTGIEYIQLNGLTKMIEGTAIPKGGLKKAAKALAMYGVDVGKEATQEMAQETVTIAGVQFAMKEDQGKWAYSSDEVVKRVAKTGVDSYLSFMLMNGAGHMMNGAKSIIAERNAAEQAGEALLQRDMAMNELLQNPETGPVVRELGWAADSVEAVMQQGLQMPQGEKAFRMAQANMARMEAGETLSAAEVGEQIKANAAAYQKVQDGSAATLTKKQQAAIRKAITDAGVTDTQAANILIQVARPGENSYSAVDADEWVENVKRVVEAVQSIEADHEGATLKNILKTALDGSKKTAAELGAEHGEGLDRAALTRATLSMMKTGEMTEDYLYSVADAVYTSLARQSRKAGNELLVSRAEGISHMIEYMEGAQGEDSAADLRSYYTVRDALIIQAAADMDAYENVIGEGAGAFLASARETVSRLGANPIRIQSRFGLTGAMENGIINLNGGENYVEHSRISGSTVREGDLDGFGRPEEVGVEAGRDTGREGDPRQRAERILAEEIRGSGRAAQKEGQSGEVIRYNLHDISEEKKTRDMKTVERIYGRNGLRVRYATELHFEVSTKPLHALIDFSTGEVILPLDGKRSFIVNAFHELAHYVRRARPAEYGRVIESIYEAVLAHNQEEYYDRLLDQYERDYNDLYTDEENPKALYEEELMSDYAAYLATDPGAAEQLFGAFGTSVQNAVNALYGFDAQEEMRVTNAQIDAEIRAAEENAKAERAPPVEEAQNEYAEWEKDPVQIAEEIIQEYMEEYGVDRTQAEELAKTAQETATVMYSVGGHRRKTMRQFPPYNESQSDANEIATRWAHQENVETGARKLISYHNAWYMIEKFDSEDLGYQIVERIRNSEYENRVREIKEYERITKRTSTLERTARIDTFHQLGSATTGGEQSVNYDVAGYRGESDPIQRVDQEQTGGRRASDDRGRNHEYDSQNQQRTDLAEEDQDIRYSAGEAQSESDVLFSLDETTSITQEDVKVIQEIAANHSGERISVNQFTSEEIKKAEPFARKYWKEMGVKSPFFRAWFGDWRAKDQTLISSVDINEDRNVKKGNILNDDTGIEISVSNMGIDHIRTHLHKSSLADRVVSHLDEITQNAVLLNSEISSKSGRTKHPNSLFMHEFYLPVKYDGKTYILKLYVEEFYNHYNNTIMRRDYDLKKIEAFADGLEVRENKSQPLYAVNKASKFTISQLFGIVKANDANFKPDSSSVVVNEDGTPKVVYHGTPNRFTVFEPQKSQRAIGFGGNKEVTSPVFFFTQNKELAERFGKNRTQPFRSSRVMAAYLNVKNPLDCTKKTASLINELKKAGFDVFKRYGYKNAPSNVDSLTLNELRKYQTVKNARFSTRELWEIADDPKVVSALKKMGYDGIIIDESDAGKGVKGDKYSYCVFSSTQIKSATDNIGTFDGNNTDIRYSAETPTQETNPLEPLVETYGAIPKGENPVREVEVPQQTSPNMYTSLFARTAMESNAVPDEMQGDFAEMVASGKMSHERLPNQVAADHATEMVRERGFEGALRDWQGYIRSGETLSPNQLAVGQLLFNMAADAKNTDLAMKLASNLAVEATKAGRSVQAFRLLKTMTPEGQLYTIEKQVEKINRELDETAGKKGKKREKITLSGDAVNRILNAKDKESLNRAVEDAEQEIADQLPVTLWEKFKAWRYLSMLANPRTHIRNIIGNAAFVPAVGMKNAIGTVIERTTPKEQRTKAFHATKEAREFAKADFEQMVPVLTGQSKYNVQTGIEGKKKIFKTVLLEKIREFNGNALEAEDLIFLRHHYVNSLAKAITARGYDISYLTSGTREANRALEEIREYAVREAQRATYRDASKVAEALNKFQHMNKVAEVAVDSFVPFKQTPVNIMKRGVEYSPIGVVKGMVELAKSRKTGETAKAIDSVSAGLSGTGLMVVAMLLSHLGILRGSKDDDDKVAMLEELQGIQDYSIKIGDYSYTLDWLAPMSMPMFVGVELMRTVDEGGISFGDAIDAIARIGDPLYEMTMLQGLQSAFRSASYSGEGPLTNVMEQMVLNYFGQAVPTLFGQFARTIDATRRMTYTPSNSPVPKVVSRMVQQQAAKIPGLSRLLEPRVDNWGREKKYEGNWVMRAISNFLSPGYISKDGTSEVEAELERLYRASGDSGVLPSSANKYFQVDGETKYLTGEEYTTYAKERGSVAYESISRLIQTDAYKNASEEEKVKIVGNAYTYANSIAKARVSDYRPDGWEAKQKASELSVADYIAAYTLVHDVKGDKYVDENGEEQTYTYSAKYNKEQALREVLPNVTDKQVEAFLKTRGTKRITPEELRILQQSKAYGRDLVSGAISNPTESRLDELDTIQEAGITPETYWKVYDATRDITSDKDENDKTIPLSKSRNMKTAIDRATPGLTLYQRELLYQRFDVSKKVW